MDWKAFHHPDWSLPVVKRRIAEEWLDLLKDVGELMATRGHRLDWNHTYPSETAYYMAMSRLRKSGLVAKRGEGVDLPQMRITEAGRAALPRYHTPERYWNTKWSGIWYTLIFDVPEAERHYRDTLRRFLKRLHMGCLQKSVWVTPRDIRPEYDDLQRAANVHAVSYLLESRAVLHRETAEIVQDAWDFRMLEKLQERYLAIYTENLEILKLASFERPALMALLCQEAEAYVICMRDDPLLPNDLLPTAYLGKKVHELHNDLRQTIANHLART